MLFILKTPNPSGAYPPIQNSSITHLPENMAEWPESLSTDIFYEYNGFVTLTINENNQVIDCQPNVTAWEEWKANLPNETEAVNTPTELEQLRADVDYIAMETGVEL